jgi:hypothetical protein
VRRGGGADFLVSHADSVTPVAWMAKIRPLAGLRLRRR